MTFGSASAAGVFGAAIAPPELRPDDDERVEVNGGTRSSAQTQQQHNGDAEAGDVANGDEDAEQHPYNQTILASAGDDGEEEEVLLEIEEDENGEGGGTITVPAASILEILEAGSDSDSESEDEDYTPPMTQDGS